MQTGTHTYVRLKRTEKEKTYDDDDDYYYYYYYYCIFGSAWQVETTADVIKSDQLCVPAMADV